MKQNTLFFAISLTVVGSLALAAPLLGQNVSQPQRQRQTAAVPNDFPRSIPVLARKAEGEPGEKLTSLLGTLSAKYSGEVKREKRDDRIRASSGSWRLDVVGDGTAAEFFDQAVAARAHESGVDTSHAMSIQALETVGRAFIDRNLAKVIVLRDGERLVRAGTSFRTESGVATDGSHAYSAVVAARIIFSREIRGVPVVGAGSKITITFLNDGAIESFRYDWPVYEPTRRIQQITSSQEILRRVQRVAAVRTNRYVGGEVDQSLKGGAIGHPVQLDEQVQLQDLKCGYYDPGLLNRDSRFPVQAGCYYHVIEKRGEGDR